MKNIGGKQKMNERKIDLRVWRKKRFEQKMMRKRNMKLNEEIFEEFVFIILFLLICLSAGIIIILKF
jgi:hypothetical protein